MHTLFAHCAHRAYLGSTLKADLSRVQHSKGNVHPTTVLAPALRNAFAHASSVAPVVITLSTSKTRLLSTWLPEPVAKALRTAFERSRRRSLCRVLVQRDWYHHVHRQLVLSLPHKALGVES